LEEKVTIDVSISPTYHPSPAQSTLAGYVGKSIFASDFCPPLALLKASAFEANAGWMNKFVARHGVTIAPHGKTSMAPKILAFQLDAGAEWISMASAQQAAVALSSGASKVLIANQVISAAALEYIATTMRNDPAVEIQLFVDSIRGVDALDVAAAKAGLGRKVDVFLEVGVVGGRAGVRTQEEALAVARSIRASAGVQLVGLAGYEGVYSPKQPDFLRKVDGYLSEVVRTAELLDSHGMFNEGPITLTAGGSKFFDRVAEIFRTAKLRGGLNVQLRCGCYLFHDIGIYDEAFEFIASRSDVARELGPLRPAIEIVSVVQSRPEARRAITNMGRRDVSYDAGLPVPIAFVPQGGRTPIRLGDDYRLDRLNDQHGFLEIPAASPIDVGDIVLFGVSHPCTVFDKWRNLQVVDDDYVVIDVVETCFT
jgi:D-serine dehydratase